MNGGWGEGIGTVGKGLGGEEKHWSECKKIEINKKERKKAIWRD